MAGGNEQCGGEPSRRYAEADGHLLHRAGDGAGVARLFFADVCISQSIHAGVLQRAEGPITKRLQHDQPNGRAEPDGSEEQQKQAEDDGIRHQHPAEANPGQNLRHEELGAHGGNRLGRNQQAGFDGA